MTSRDMRTGKTARIALIAAACSMCAVAAQSDAAEGAAPEVTPAEVAGPAPPGQVVRPSGISSVFRGCLALILFLLGFAGILLLLMAVFSAENPS